MASKKNRNETVVIPCNDGDELIVNPDNGDVTAVCAGESITVKPVNPILAKLQGVRGKSLADCATSLDLSTPVGRARAFNLCARADYEIKDKGEVVIEVDHYLVHEAMGEPDDGGEIKPYLRAAFLTTQGKVFATSSPVVLSRLAELLSFYNDLKFDGPIVLKISETYNRKKTAVYHQLRIVPQEDLDSGKEQLS